MERYGWGRVGWFLIEWWNYISLTFLCIFEKHRHHSYLCHHCLRYRCFIFDRDPEYHQNYLRFHYNIFMFVSLTVNSPLLHYISFILLRDDGKTAIIITYTTIITIYSLYYLIVAIFFDRVLWFHWIFLSLSHWQPIFPIIHYISFILLHKKSNNHYRNHQVSFKISNKPCFITFLRIDGQWTRGFINISMILHGTEWDSWV